METRSETSAVPEPVANARPSHPFSFPTGSRVFWRWHVSFSSNYATAVPQPVTHGRTHNGSQRIFGKLSLGDLDNGTCCCFGKNSSDRIFTIPVARRPFLWGNLFIIIYSELQNNEGRLELCCRPGVVKCSRNFRLRRMLSYMSDGIYPRIYSLLQYR